MRAARANRLFGTEMKRVRTKKTVMDKSDCELGLFQSKITACARMCCSSVRKRQSARTGRRPRKSDHHNPKYLPALVRFGGRSLRAPRANRIFRTDKKRIRTENAVLVNTEYGVGF
ncbi:MAG: hypothetical protein AAB150_07050 [Pseudomonadota bacterium]